MPNGERGPTGERGPNVVSLSAELLRHGKVLPTVAQQVFTGEDFLHANVVSNVAGTLTMRGRFLDGHSSQVLPFRVAFPFAAGVQTQVFMPPGIGYLLSASFEAFIGPAAPNVAPAFVWVNLSRGQTDASAVALYSMVSGYSTSQALLSWPWSQWQWNRDTVGWPKKVTGTTPAAGAEISEVIPNVTVARLVAVRFILTTSAAPGNRAVRVIIQTGAPIAFLTVIEAAAVHPPSAARGYNFYVGAALAPGLVDNQNIPWPEDIWLTTGDKFTTNTVAFDAADQYSNIRYQFQEWREIA